MPAPPVPAAAMVAAAAARSVGGAFTGQTANSGLLWCTVTPDYACRAGKCRYMSHLFHMDHERISSAQHALASPAPARTYYFTSVREPIDRCVSWCDTERATRDVAP